MKKIVQEYDANRITADEINGLTEMLKHDSFKPIHEDIIAKIKEIEAVFKTRKKTNRIPSDKATRIRKKKTSMPTTEDEKKLMDEMMPVIFFTYLIDKKISQDFEDRNKKPKNT